MKQLQIHNNVQPRLEKFKLLTDIGKSLQWRAYHQHNFEEDGTMPTFRCVTNC